MTESAKPQRRAARPAAPSIVYIAIASAIAVVIALLPRTGNQPPPQTVAEFAPQASKEIRQTQSETYSGGGGCASADCKKNQDKNKVATPPPPPPIKVPLVKQCYGDPPRQSEDPQSPPCIPYWVGNNGGATSRGVTGNTITVAFPVVGFEKDGEVQDLNKFFNENYQFYGRTINLVEYSPQDSLYAQPVPAHEQSDAQKVYDMGAFASLSTGGRYGAENLYYDTLAHDHIISIAHRAGAKTDAAHYAQYAPYEWSVMPGIDTMQRHMGEFVCNVLKGRTASYAGPGSNTGTRIFGLVYDQAQDGTSPDVSLVSSLMKSCGATPAAERSFSPTNGNPNANATNIMLAMIEAHVTSIVCFCDNANTKGALMDAATSEQYEPEWILSSYIDSDIDNSFSQSSPVQASHVIGVTFRNKVLDQADMPWYWAFKKADSAATPSNGDGYDLMARYSSLLLLASGIQTAGPNLTPETFQAGLFSTHFPDPGAEGPPYYQAQVGFDGSSHSFIQDAAMYWYDVKGKGTVDPTNVGRVCYVDEGKRYQLGQWPHSEPTFFGTCSP
ncbi:MAG: type 1 periplasmic-binding domain-containing protein [Actinomycetota bacterium]